MLQSLPSKYSRQRANNVSKGYSPSKLKFFAHRPDLNSSHLMRLSLPIDTGTSCPEPPTLTAPRETQSTTAFGFCSTWRTMTSNCWTMLEMSPSTVRTLDSKRVFRCPCFNSFSVAGYGWSSVEGVSFNPDPPNLRCLGLA